MAIRKYLYLLELFSALRSTNGYICQFSVQQQEAEPEPGSNTHSLNPTSFETPDLKNQHFHLGNSKVSEKDMVMMINSSKESLSSSSSSRAVPMVSFLHCTWEKAGNSWPTWAFFSSLDIQRQGELQNGPNGSNVELSLNSNSHSNIREISEAELCFLIFPILQNLLCFLVGTAHKKGSWSF